eukprot:4043687-Pleurochrysis_carterae.AAC.1
MLPRKKKNLACGEGRSENSPKYGRRATANKKKFAAATANKKKFAACKTAPGRLRSALATRLVRDDPARINDASAAALL